MFRFSWGAQNYLPITQEFQVITQEFHVITQECHVKIHVKSEAGEYGPVEDAHLIINHVLAHWFQNKLK